MNTQLNKRKKYLIIVLFSITFFVTLVNNIPAWILGDIVSHYSQNRLKLYDVDGTFWSGSGLLVAVETKKQIEESPLLQMNWNVKLGLRQFITVTFTVDSNPVAIVYVDKSGVNLSKLNLSLSMTQLSQLVDIAKAFAISGNLNISSDRIHFGKKLDGMLNIKLDNVSSTISRVNPLGSYLIKLTLATGGLNFSSLLGNALMLSGNGDLTSLTLKAQVDDLHKDEMQQFMTVMGVQLPDGSYQLKVF